MEGNDEEIISKFNKELVDSTVENVDIMKEIIEKCRLCEGFSIKVLNKTQFLQFIETTLKKSQKELNKNTLIWNLLSILTTYNSLISTFLENEIDEKIYSSILAPLSGIKEADISVRSDILFSFYNIVSKDKNKRICNKSDLVSCISWLLQLIPPMIEKPPSSLLIPFFLILLLFCESKEEFLNELKLHKNKINDYMIHPKEEVWQLCDKVCELIDPYDDSEDKSNDLQTKNEKIEEEEEEEEEDKDFTNSPITKLNEKFLQKLIIDMEKEKKEPNYSELVEQKKKEEMKEEEKKKIENEEKRQKEKKAPNGSINSNNKMKEDCFLLPQNVVNAIPVESHSSISTPHEIIDSSPKISPHPPLLNSSLSNSVTNNNEDLEDKGIDEVVFTLKDKFEEFMKTQTFISIIFIAGMFF